jgi:hypothetical protein
MTGLIDNFYRNRFHEILILRILALTLLLKAETDLKIIIANKLIFTMIYQC